MIRTETINAPSERAPSELVDEMAAIRAEIAERTRDLTDEQLDELAARLADEIMDSVVEIERPGWNR